MPLSDIFTAVNGTIIMFKNIIIILKTTYGDLILYDSEKSQYVFEGISEPTYDEGCRTTRHAEFL
jgi:hypothetical protein